MPTPPQKLTDEEKAKIRAHLRFPVIDGRVALGLGLPVSTDTSYIVDSAMDRVLPQGVPMVRRCLAQLECLDAELVKLSKGTQVAGVTGVQLRPREALEDIEDQQDYWRRRLADSLGVVVNPVAQGGQRGDIILVEPC